LYLAPLNDEEHAGTLAKQQRYWVAIDRDKLQAVDNFATIRVTSADGADATIDVLAKNLVDSLSPDFRGHVDTDGHVSIEAEHFSDAVGGSAVEWQVVPGLGRTLSGVMPMPVTAPIQTPGDGAPHLEYRILSSSKGPVRVQAFVSPTLNYHNGEGLRYAVSFDNEPPIVVNIHAGEKLQLWEKWVADSINVTTSEHQLPGVGEHTLKYWMVDPGVVLQKLVIDTGGLRPSYLGPPESTRWPTDSTE
jgi:hypothetical protein